VSGGTAAPRPDAPGGSCRVRLEAFEGPLEVLLHLVRCQEIDIADIPLIEVARQCDEYLALMAGADLESAGDHLVMASTLTHIKSRRLLPASTADRDADAMDEAPAGEGDPAAAFRGVLRRAAEQLQEREAIMELVFARPAERVAEFAGEQWIEADLYALLNAFQSILKRIGGEDPAARITRERVTLVERIQWLLEVLGREGRVAFRALFSTLEDRLACILTFLALLEVIRMRLARAYQSRRQEDLLIVLTAEPAAPPPAPRAEVPDA